METKNDLSAELESLAGLDKIREILVGANLRNVDERLRDLDAEGARALQVLRDDVRERFDALERRLEEHVAALGRRLEAQDFEKLNRSQLAGLLQELAKRVEHGPGNGKP